MFTVLFLLENKIKKSLLFAAEVLVKKKKKDNKRSYIYSRMAGYLSAKKADFIEA